jgi:hypothetical protein
MSLPQKDSSGQEPVVANDFTAKEFRVKAG